MYPYEPRPVDTGDVTLSPELAELSELLARNTHDTWAKNRIQEGWTYGPVRDDGQKTHPDLVPYEALTEGEKDYDRATSQETLKLILKLGFTISKEGC